MRKLTLQLDNLQVDSFVTSVVGTNRGTVVGKSYPISYQTCQGFHSCNNYTCDQTCHSCGGPSCDQPCESVNCYSTRCVDM